MRQVDSPHVDAPHSRHDTARSRIAPAGLNSSSSNSVGRTSSPLTGSRPSRRRRASSSIPYADGPYVLGRVAGARLVPSCCVTAAAFLL